MEGQLGEVLQTWVIATEIIKCLGWLGAGWGKHMPTMEPILSKI